MYSDSGLSQMKQGNFKEDVEKGCLRLSQDNFVFSERHKQGRMST